MTAQDVERERRLSLWGSIIPRTSRPLSRDAAEVEATKNANRLPINGLPYNSTHHDAYDAQLFAIHPDTLSIVAAPDISPTDIGLGEYALALKQRRPHRYVICFRPVSSELTLEGGGASWLRSQRIKEPELVYRETKAGFQEIHAARVSRR